MRVLHGEAVVLNISGENSNGAVLISASPLLSCVAVSSPWATAEILTLDH